MKPRSVVPVLFLLPAFVIYAIVIVYPAVYSLFLSLFRWDGIAPHKVFVGLGNYVYLFTQDFVFRTALWNNVLWLAAFLVIPTGIGLALALLLNRAFPGRVVFRGLFYFPFILSNIVVAMIWEWIYYPEQGLIDKFLHIFGLSQGAEGVLGDPHTATLAIIAAACWQGTGAPMVLFLAGLQAIPKEPYEAAKVEGASSLQTFLFVTLPMLRETLVIVISTSLVGALRVFDIVFAMTGGGPAQSSQVLSTWMYSQTFTFSQLGIGSAISWVMVLLIAIMTIPYVLYASRESHA